MFKKILIRELKSIPRDKMYMFLMIYPIIMIIVGLLLVPYFRSINQELAANIMIVLFILMMGFMYGAITGFTLLDDQDDKVLLSLRITPISVEKYVLIKMLINYIFGFIFTSLLVLITGFLKDASFIHILMILVIAPMQGPIIALLINSFATNKVEGFVYMKLSGIILLIPVASLFLTNWTEFFLGVVPGFWSARLISMQLLPLDFILSPWLYFILGILAHGLCFTLFYKLYMKRIIT
jgi:fluoroquinolone transport system permease protein